MGLFRLQLMRVGILRSRFQVLSECMKPVL